MTYFHHFFQTIDGVLGTWRDQIWIWSSNLNRNQHKKVIWNFIANQRWGNQSSIVAMYDCKAIIKGYLRVLNQLITQYKSRLVSIFLRVLVYQNTALLSYFRLFGTGVTSELFSIIWWPGKPYISECISFWLHSGYNLTTFCLHSAYILATF